MKKNVVIVEDDALLQKQLAATLKRAADIECLYAVSSGEEALRRIPRQPPDVVLMDIKLPGISGIECVAELKKTLPALDIIMLTIYQDDENIFQALKAGASGYLLKSSESKKLHAAIRDVAAGGAPFSNYIARKVVQHFRGREQEQPNKKLSPREEEVLGLMATGYRYKEIADQLSISVETVRFHVKNICAKMHVRDRIHAVAKHFSRAG
ncbi:MAG: response regulator transcription factor [Verrucomicrobiales bacterium]|jgi:DNA-binding NarL/FixJ family response regulator|nr:response regulator transcription factor [Verrucomicrobiales bacterium]